MLAIAKPFLSTQLALLTEVSILLVVAWIGRPQPCSPVPAARHVTPDSILKWRSKQITSDQLTMPLCPHDAMPLQDRRPTCLPSRHARPSSAYISLRLPAALNQFVMSPEGSILHNTRDDALVNIRLHRCLERCGRSAPAVYKFHPCWSFSHPAPTGTAL